MPLFFSVRHIGICVDISNWKKHIIFPAGWTGKTVNGPNQWNIVSGHII